MRWVSARSGAVAALAGAVVSLHAGLAEAGPVTATWTNSSGGPWGMGSNWSTNPDVPNNGGTNYIAVLPAISGMYTVTLDLPITVTGFTMQSMDPTLDLGNFNLDVESNYLQDGGMVVGGTGEIAVQGAAEFRNAILMGVSMFRSMGTLTFNSTTFDDICDTPINHSGSQILWTGTGDILLGGSSGLTNGAGSTFDIQSSRSLFWDNMGTRPTVANLGTIVRSAGAGTTDFTDVILDNQGALRVEAGALQSNMTANVSGGALTGGTWEVRSGASLDLLGQAITTNNADVTLRDSGSLFNALESNIQTNGASGSLTLLNGRDFTTTGDFQNDGALMIGAATDFTVAPGFALQNVVGNALTGGAFEIQGSLRVDNADIQSIASDLTLDGPGADIFDPAMAQSALTDLNSISASGALSLMNGRNLTTSGAFQNSGDLAIGAATTFEVDSGSSFQNVVAGVLSGGTFDISGALRFAGDITGIDAPVTLTGAAADIVDSGDNTSALSGVASIENSGAFNLRMGRSLTTANDFVVRPTGVLSIDTASTFEVAPGFILQNFSGGTFSDGVFDVRGTLRFPNAMVNTIENDITLDGPGLHIVDTGNNDAFTTLNLIRPTGVLALRNGADLSVQNNITVQGRLIIGNATGTFVRGVSNGSVLTLENEMSEPQTLMLSDDSFLQGGGFIVGHLISDGEVAPGADAMTPGVLALAGDLTLNDPGSFAFKIGGLSPGIDYDQFLIDGAAMWDPLGDMLAGTLRVSLINGFMPMVGQSFTVMTFDSRVGMFAGYEGTELPGDLGFLPVYSDTELRLVVVAIPAPPALAPLFAACAICLRRRPRA